MNNALANQYILANILSIKKVREAQSIQKEKEMADISELQDVPWFGEKSINALIEKWITSKYDLVHYDKAELKRFLSPFTYKSAVNWIEENKHNYQ